MNDRFHFELAVEKLLLEQLPGVVLSATDGNTRLDKHSFSQNGDELVSEFVGLVEAIGELYAQAERLANEPLTSKKASA